MGAFSSNEKHFEQFWGFQRHFERKCEALIKNTRLLKTLQRNGGFCLEMWRFYKDFKCFWRFLQKIEALSSIVGLFEYIFSGKEPSHQFKDERLFSQCLCGLYKTDCRKGFLAPVHPCLFPLTLLGLPCHMSYARSLSATVPTILYGKVTIKHSYVVLLAFRYSVQQ
jgi:hypothetical protein